MAKPRILVSRRLPDRVMTSAADLFEIVTRGESPMTEYEAIESLMENDGVLPTLADDFGTGTLLSVDDPRCRILANFGVGYDHIDTLAAEHMGIVVTNTPGAVTDATADIAMTLLMMTARRAGEGERLVRSGNWPGWHPTQMLGRQVTGKTVGVIGFGRIGAAVARRCHFGFNMKVVYYNRSPVSDCGLPATRMASLHEVCSKADFVVVSLASNPQTRHMIDGSVLSSMNSDGILINISRGEIIDEQALIDALGTGRIAAAGLDVYEFEPHVPDGLMALDNVVLLPHLGTSVLSVREDMGMMAVRNLEAFFAGKPPPNRVG